METGSQLPHSRFAQLCFVIILMIVTLVIATGVDALRATRFVMVLVARSFVAIVTTFLAPAVIPDRVGHDIDNFHRCVWIVTCDNQFATPRTLFSRLVPNQDTQARAGM